jgi:hypothetical protein
MSRLRYGPSLVASLAATVLLLSGCGGGAAQSTSEAGGAAAEPAAKVPAPMNLTRSGAARQDSGSSGAGQDSAASGSQDSANPGTAQGGTQVKIQEPDRAIIYTGELTVRAKDVGAAAERAKQIVTAAGGRLDGETSTSFNSEGNATLVFKIPPDRYQAVVDQVGKELGKRESLRQGTEDVTEQVADVDSRLKSARSSLDQLRTLLAKAKTIGEVLSVEREISGREADLESLQARQKVLAAQTGMATLTLNLVGPSAVVVKPAPEPPGFLSGLKSGWKALVGTARVALNVIGVLLPWLVVLGVLWLAFVAVRRRVPALRARPSRAGAPSRLDGEEEGASRESASEGREKALAGAAATPPAEATPPREP